jgi:hypothetical protein
MQEDVHSAVCWQWIFVNLAVLTLIWYPKTILTLMIYQVHIHMWFLEFIIYVGIKHLNEDFRVKFIGHFTRRSWSLAQVKTHDKYDSKGAKDQSVNVWNTEDLNRRRRSSRVKHPYLNCRENYVKDPHAVRQKLKKTGEASGSKTEVKRSRMGLGHSAQAGRPNPLSAPFAVPLWPNTPSIYL